MIKSCEDVKTVRDFNVFGYFLSRTYHVGLRETTLMLRWNKKYLICPMLFEKLNENRIQ